MSPIRMTCEVNGLPDVGGGRRRWAVSATCYKGFSPHFLTTDYFAGWHWLRDDSAECWGWRDAGGIDPPGGSLP